MKRPVVHILLCLLGVLFFTSLKAQNTQFKNPAYGRHDTIMVTGILYEGELMPYKELETVYVSSLPHHKMVEAIAKYNRLRNAVYVTYPYARRAGVTLNEVNEHLKNVTSKAVLKTYIKSREKELKDQFTDPLSNLSVYQGKILMKLINRQTGNNCYEIIKEYRGGMNARLYQTVAFFFGSSLKQDYDPIAGTDHQIETIVHEIDASWYNNPYKPGVKQ